MQLNSNRHGYALGCFLILGAIGFAASNQEESLSIEAELIPVANEPTLYQVEVDIQIPEGWHTYASVPASNPSAIMAVSIDLPRDIQAVGDLQIPAGAPYAPDASVEVFEGTVTFMQLIQVEPAAQSRAISIGVDFQICNELLCLPPQKASTEISVPGASKLEDADSKALFAAPIMLLEGDSPLNTKAKQMYPSPAFYDIDGDGENELIIGDIFGRLNVYENTNATGKGDPQWSTFKSLQSTDGKKIDVSNW